MHFFYGNNHKKIDLERAARLVAGSIPVKKNLIVKDLGRASKRQLIFFVYVYSKKFTYIRLGLSYDAI